MPTFQQMVFIKRHHGASHQGVIVPNASTSWTALPSPPTPLGDCPSNPIRGLGMVHSHPLFSNLKVNQ